MALQDHLRSGAPVRFGLVIQGRTLLCSSQDSFEPPIPLRPLEDAALGRCSGRTLDVAAGAGRHSLILMEKGIEILPIDIEPRCVEVMKSRGLNQALCADVFQLAHGRFDTILILQQTIGIAGTLAGLGSLLGSFRKMLAPKGQVLLDSTSPVLPGRTAGYAGQLSVQLVYADQTGPAFPFLWIDSDVLGICAQAAGFDCEVIMEGPNPCDYLCRLIVGAQ